MTEARLFRVDDLLGRVVRDENGRRVGRIYDIRAELSHGSLVIREYLLGPGAFFHRVGLSLLAGDLEHAGPRRIAWHDLDVSNPRHPRLTSGGASQRENR